MDTQIVTRVFTAKRSVQQYDQGNDLVIISLTDNRGKFEQQTFMKPRGKKWDDELDKLERMALKLLVHNLLLK